MRRGLAKEIGLRLRQLRPGLLERAFEHAGLLPFARQHIDMDDQLGQALLGDPARIDLLTRKLLRTQ